MSWTRLELVRLIDDTTAVEEVKEGEAVAA